ncbi:MAG: imidazole glycerol phosphate synthase subunit HisH [Chloroflexi bacterium]|nr:imidazole glycerol phosphate synthase subunit HisH [Chloroflexota bacterium]
MIAIVDYGAGNLRSVARAVTYLGYAPTITDDPEALLRADAVIVPGQGAGGDCVRCLRERGLAEAIKEYIRRGRPFLGVCIGLQVLFDTTEEGGLQPCLGIVPGAVRRLPEGLKVPHMGWNQVRFTRPHPVLDGIPDHSDFYFVHSYYVAPADPALALGETEYGITFCSMIAAGNLVATQFHPEKSGKIGLRLYDNFLRIATGGHPRD